MKKDIHLVAGALATGKEIVSRDAAARELYERLAVDVEDLEGIVWLDPIQGDMPIHRP